MIRNNRNKKGDVIMKELLYEYFPNIKFENLIKQTTEIITKDACTHYLNKEFEDVYSYNYIRQAWTRNQYDYDDVFVCERVTLLPN